MTAETNEGPPLAAAGPHSREDVVELDLSLEDARLEHEYALIERELARQRLAQAQRFLELARSRQELNPARDAVGLMLALDVDDEEAMRLCMRPYAGNETDLVAGLAGVLFAVAEELTTREALRGFLEQLAFYMALD